MLNLSKAALRSAFAKLRAWFADGKEHEEIAELLGFSATDYEELLAKFYDTESQAIRDKTTEHVYVDYCLQSTQNIRDLTKLLTNFKETKQHSAMVGAIRARQDIYDRMIARGQEFGFIEKKPEQKIIAGVLVAQLTDGQLRGAITDQLGHLDEMMSLFGGGKNIIDIDPGPTHVPTPKRKALGPGDGKVSGTRNSGHKGRRVVKEKSSK